jgi:hypothetical protein
MNGLRRVLLACGPLVLLFFAACGGGELDDFGCHSNSDCKHGRVCVAGICQDSGGVCSSNSDCPAGQTCFQGNCLTCDQDGDGHLGTNCAGDDCDDSNAGVHPGALELCGDGLDNDCDGVADPPDFCAKCADVVCQVGYACDPKTGVCVPICTPDCAGAECGSDGCGGSCGECPTGYHCSGGRRCVAGCEDLCKVPGDKLCSGNGVVTCEDGDGDGCLEWNGPVPCPTGLRCVEGECVECRPDCTGKECGSDGCGGSCGVCPADMYCDGGRCSSGCRDECTWGQTRCADAYSYSVCGEYDGDPCSEWSPRQPCLEGTVCDQTTGYCSGGCKDECFWGESYCLDDIAYVECGDFNGDGCTEFGPPTICDPDSYCDWDIGRCSNECYNDFDWGDFSCLSGREYITCGQWDNDPCADWSPPQRCPRQTRCSQDARQCVDGSCENDCEEWMSQCWDDWTFVFCGQFDNDPCLEWSPPQSCPPDTRCDFAAGQCVPYQDCQPDVYEPNDNMVQATPLFPGEPMAHSICPSGDDDWWVFSTDEAGEVVVDLSGPYGDTVMWLYDINGQQLAYDDDGGPDMFSRIDLPGLPAGRYYVQVQEFNDYGIIENYYIHLTTSGTCHPDCTGRECGPDPVCGQICGTCQAGWQCSAAGQCVYDGHRQGAGDPCGFFVGCPADYAAAYACVEYPGSTDGLCSYPCNGPDDCAVDFPQGCCRELAEGYSVCLPGELCQNDYPGYLDECNGACLPDMFCIQSSASDPAQNCIFSCDLAMGICPMGGTCIDPGQNGTTGYCLPQGAHQFGEACTVIDGCSSGMMCLPLDENHPGYCSRMCSAIFPCPGPFQCILPDGQGGQWCAVPCYQPSDCAILGDWTCSMIGGNMGACVPN